MSLKDKFLVRLATDQRSQLEHMIAAERLVARLGFRLGNQRSLKLYLQGRRREVEATATK